MKLQGLRREFEYTRMRDDESLYSYLTKLFDLMNQMKSYCGKLSRERVTQKLVISLPPSYDSICSVIEHSKDLGTIEVHEVVASSKGHEQRHERHIENRTERAFASLSVRPKQAKFTGNQNTKYQKNWKTKGQKWDNKPLFFFGRYKPTYQARKQAIGTDGAKNPCKFYDKLHFGECWFKGKPKCHNCDKIFHIAKDCNNKKTV